jgi:hypothetical protein
VDVEGKEFDRSSVSETLCGMSLAGSFVAVKQVILRPATKLGAWRRPCWACTLSTRFPGPAKVSSQLSCARTEVGTDLLR